MRGRAIVLVALLVALGACGGGKGGGAARRDPASDLALARSVVLTTSDLPGYTTTPHQRSDDVPAPAKAGFAACMHLSATWFDDAPSGQTAYSPNFRRGQSVVEAFAKVEGSAAVLDARWRTFTEPGIEHCLERYFQSLLEAKLSSAYTFGTLTATRFAVGLGPRSIGFRFRVPFTVNTLDPVIYVDVVLFVRGRAGAQLEAESVAEPFDRATELRLARSMYDRLGDRAG